MPLALLLPNYLIWHYTKGFRELLINWGHILYFTIYFFSIPNLLLTLLSPWKRMDEGSQRTINPSAIMEHLIFNSIMRIVGLLIRSITIVIGLLATATLITGGFLFVLVWLVLPVLLTALVAIGVKFIVQPV